MENNTDAPEEIQEEESSSSEEVQEDGSEGQEKTVPYSRFKEVNDKKKELEDQLTKQKEEEAPQEEVKPEPQNTDIEGRVELRLQGYSQNEVLEISSIAKAKGISLSEAAELPLVKKGIEGIRAEQKVEETTPSPSSRNFAVKGKTWAQMTNAERKENFHSFSESIGKKRNETII